MPPILFVGNAIDIIVEAVGTIESELTAVLLSLFISFDTSYQENVPDHLE